MDTDVLVAGAGPGGATAATLLSKQGLKVLLLEKDEFPRFKVGESLLPHSLDILRESGAIDRVDSGKYIRKYGAQFIDESVNQEFYFNFSKGLDSQHPYAFEVDRSEFDKDLLEHAQDCGVQVLQPLSVTDFEEHDDHILIHTKDKSIKTKYFIDASGKSSLIGNKYKLRKKNPLFNHMAIFSHFKGCQRRSLKNEGDIIIGILPNKAWSWHIPFQGDITSVGIVCHPELYKNSQCKNNFIKNILLEQPRLREIMNSSQQVLPTQLVSNYSFNIEKLVGPRWLLLGDAASFLDPVFSSGVHVALKSAQLASQTITQAFSQESSLLELGSSYEQDLRKGVQRFKDLLQIFYRTPFVRNCKKLENRPQSYKAMVSAVSGDMWNDDNPLFRFNTMPGMVENAHNLSL